MALKNPKSAVLVKAAGIHKSFADGRGVNPTSFKVMEGELLGLVGANGGGKTTILRMLAGLLPADGGELSVLGHALPSAKRALRHDIGYVAQSQSLYQELTVRENLKFYADSHNLAHPGQTVEDVLQRFGLLAFANTRVKALSGGWARLVQLAAGLLHGPPLLLLDEPAVGLDAATRADLWAHVRRYAVSGSAVVVATHDLAEANRCDRILYFADGDLQASGSLDDVIATANICSYIIENNDLTTLPKVLVDHSGLCSAHNDAGSLRAVVLQEKASDFLSLAETCCVSVSIAQASLTDASMAFHRRRRANG